MGVRRWRLGGGFTLVELLVVIGIIAVLVGILMPALSRARESGRCVRCMANLRAIGQGMLNYSADHQGYVVPAYNLPWDAGSSTNYAGGAGKGLDGWACILDRDGYVKTSERDLGGVFCCPNTEDVPGLETGATGDGSVVANRANPRGWVDWPMAFLGSGDTAPKKVEAIPERGFKKVIRVGYWINAYHPVGQVLSAGQVGQRDLYYSTVVGYGDAGGWTRPHKVTAVRNASLTVAVADGVFMGRQSVDQLGMTNSTIGYRHRGRTAKSAANVLFVDGHVETVWSERMPCAYATSGAYAGNGGRTTLAEQIEQNASGATVYMDPRGALGIFMGGNPGAN